MASGLMKKVLMISFYHIHIVLLGRNRKEWVLEYCFFFFFWGRLFANLAIDFNIKN